MRRKGSKATFDGGYCLPGKWMIGKARLTGEGGSIFRRDTAKKREGGVGRVSTEELETQRYNCCLQFVVNT